MREHQIVITLKPEQFLEVQRLARAAGAKSMGMFVRQKLMSVLGIDGAPPEPAKSGNGTANAAAVANAARVAGELRRLHGELKMFVAESLSKPYIEEDTPEAVAEQPVEIAVELDSIDDETDDSSNGDYLDENPFITDEPADEENQADSVDEELIEIKLSMPIQQQTDIIVEPPEPGETRVFSSQSTLNLTSPEGLPDFPSHDLLGEMPEPPFIEPDSFHTKLTEALTGWGELVNDLPGGGWMTTPAAEMSSVETVEPGSEAAHAEAETDEFAGLRPKLPEFPPEPGSLAEQEQLAQAGYGTDPDEMSTEELQQSFGSLPELGLSRKQLKQPIPDPLQSPPLPPTPMTAAFDEDSPATLEEAIKEFESAQDDLEQLAKKAFAISPRLGALQPGTIGDLSRPAMLPHAEPDPLSELLEEDPVQTRVETYQASSQLDNDPFADEDADEDEVFDVPLRLDERPRTPVYETPIPQMPQTPIPPAALPQTSPPPPPPAPPPPPRPSGGSHGSGFSGGPPPRRR